MTLASTSAGRRVVPNAAHVGVSTVRALALGTTAVVLTACGAPDEEAAASAITVVDSAGVTVVTHAAAAMESAPEWTLAAEPEWILGSESTPLSDVGDATILPDGAVAVADQGSEAIVIFRTDGSVERTLGGEGDGPGEFHWVGQVFARGADTIAAYAWNSGRWAEFLRDGTVLGTHPLPDIPGARAAAHLHPLETGFVLHVLRPPFSYTPVEGIERAAVESARLAADGSVEARYGPFPGMTTLRTERIMGAPWFGASTVGDTRRDGAFVVGTAEATEIRAYGPDGQVLQVVRWPDTDRAVGEERVEVALARVLEETPAEKRAMMERMMTDLEAAPEWPPYDRILTDPSGRAWVGSPREPLAVVSQPTARRWLVFDPDGRVLATLDTAVDFDVKEVTDDLLVGVYRDELERETVRGYRYGPG